MQPPPNPVFLGLPRGRYVRLEREDADGNWQFVHAYPVEYADRIQLADNEMLSCGCGSYAYGKCELCADEEATK